ncbi:uncharacterized protein I206_107742 [Kwoniella pini CBS 10737]|uniref:Coiled-coil domain-containing protein 130 n=1 Tax=Kwoniella pini CBS 10737 TaxID=1296096 RepID=A0A1B9HY90_9TREE|nr:uncharacterized protein I206_06076 [Kwoniella pini CBS 10737]OCF48208.1 hypothetical protein I206_06076 [Kwoniella pini CBS 10737]
MQGLNRYIPPDYDPRQNSTLNSHQGKKHALGVRAKDIDKGILVVRFELPFNIWCGTCNAHIGAGVRYNARKQKVGNYYSTPIYGFKCKCHLCDGWFEIRTDPKNAAYLVYSGAKKKDEDWNPEENGGFAVHDTEAPSASEPPLDPFAGVEKTIDQQKWAKKGTSRLTELTNSSDRLNSDPYLISSSLRRKFREEKKLLLEKQIKDDNLKLKFGLNESINFESESVDEVDDKSKKIWEIIIQNKKNGESSNINNSSIEVGNLPTPKTRKNGKGKVIDTKSPDLINLLRSNTEKKYDPFADLNPIKFTSKGSSIQNIKGKGKIKSNIIENLTPKTTEKDTNNSIVNPAICGLLAGYTSD